MAELPYDRVMGELNEILDSLGVSQTKDEQADIIAEEVRRGTESFVQRLPDAAAATARKTYLIRGAVVEKVKSSYAKVQKDLDQYPFNKSIAGGALGAVAAIAVYRIRHRIW